MMITFADGKKPPVVDAIKAANIPHTKFFKFNNSAIYPHSEQKHQDAFDSSEEEDEGGDFSRMFWNMGMKSFENFFTRFKVVEPQSLQLTNEVLEERQRLETTINRLQPQINERLAKIEELRDEERILKEHESDMLTNKDFKYTVTLTKQRKVDLNPGHYVTNCLVCNYTCHEDCRYNNDCDKWRCSAMDDGDMNTASCRVCPGGGCHWTQHVNNPYRFELYQEDEERTQEDLKQKYAEAAEGKVHVQGMIKTINDHLSQLDEHVTEMFDQVRDSSKRLGEIALKPNPLTEVEYIDILIESEKQEVKPGYKARIKYLQDARKRAQLATEALSTTTSAGRHRSEIALKPNSPRAQQATGGIPTPAGRHRSVARTSLWTSMRNLW
jgi:predicted nuclease with TOPRIM domain